MEMEREKPEMKQLVRTTLELEQFECEMCGRMVYINKMDIEDMKQRGKAIIPDCPFDCWSETKHRRTVRAEVREVKDTPDLEIMLSVGDIRRNGDEILCE